MADEEGFVTVKCLAMQGLQQNWWDSCRYHRKYKHLKLRESVTMWRNFYFYFFYFLRMANTEQRLL